MRHRKSFNHLGRTKAHRKAMLANMASSLIVSKKITTTTAKAKALRKYIEPLITKAKDDSTHSRRVVYSYLNDKHAVTELFREVSVKVADRPGGYTRILKTGKRLGDNADMCIIELVDYNENLLAAKSETKKKTTRRSRRGGSKPEVETTVENKESQEVVSEKNEDIEEVKEETTVKDEEKITDSDSKKETEENK